MSLDEQPPRPIDRTLVVKAAASLGMLGSDGYGAPRIMAALCNQSASAEQLAALVRQEPALYVRVLKVANSSFYGQSRAVTSIERAFVLLGVKAISAVIAAACLDHGLARGRRIEGVDLNVLLNHSVATAAACESLARRRHGALAGDAFIAGLLHDLGMVVQAQLDSPRLQMLLERRQAGDTRSIRILESEVGLIGHEECIAVVFEEWGLPCSLVAAVRHHHAPQSAPEEYRALSSLVHVGAGLSHRVDGSPKAGVAPPDPDESIRSWLGLGDADIEGVAFALPAAIAELQASLLAT